MASGARRRCLVSAALCFCSLGAALALVVYGNGATWERELPPCASERSACSLVHRRYWLSPLEVRLCRCPRKEPCPEGFDTAPGGSALNVTSRTQLKVCSGWHAPVCNASQVSLVTKVVRKLGPGAQANDTRQTHADVVCRCSVQDAEIYYRRAHGNSTASSTYYEQRQYFTCESIPDCKPEEPCGHVTRDFYAIYRTCNCPPNNLCTVPMNFSDRRLVNVRKALYEGAAYVALCQPY
ncbi:U-scoloptoxin(11)-Ssd3a-like [Amblyomma americanum]